MGVSSMMAKALAAGMLLLCTSTARAGPPFQTDDPQPVDFHHYEFYTFGSLDGTGVELDTFGPALEFNWGILPNTQFHIVFPAAAIYPYNNAKYFPAGTGPNEWGVGDTEIGVKYRFVNETKHVPMIGTFTMLEVPTGDSNRGLGVGKVWARLPIWAQKSWGPWTTYGGAGETIVPQTGFQNFPFAGWLLQRDIGKKLTLGTELFAHGAEGIAATQQHSATLVDFGGYYYFRNPGFQLLFCYGHSVAGPAETYAYLGLYWTWGHAKNEGKSEKSLLGKLHHLDPFGRS